MKIPLYHVDAFASRVFAGNPAAVCPLESWLPDATLQAIAAENNLSETAFFVSRDGAYDLRWFTPAVEVDLCGHATLASAYVIFERLSGRGSELRFHSKSGPLRVLRDGERLALDFPSRPPQPVAAPEDIAAALGREPRATLAARDYFFVFEDEEQLRGLRPDMARVAALDRFAAIVTAPGREVDFVSRFFAPSQGIAEDPVTGSAHCSLIPYWAERLGKTRLHALQVSARGGELFCEDKGDRVLIAGHAVLYLEGTLAI